MWTEKPECGHDSSSDRSTTPKFVMIDLEFDRSSEVEAFRAALRDLWRKVEGKVMESPRARIVEVAESKEY